jgi:hypothetical protein
VWGLSQSLGGECSYMEVRFVAYLPQKTQMSIRVSSINVSFEHSLLTVDRSYIKLIL